ncbi:methionyl-tRNA formyltransferase [Methanocalculus sp. AMF5]|uniref:formyltransferase family protein n=1 Tax=Methanocalculus sp. AMF5 TaxID=1198257 RepID=UPI00209F408D|nr:formyltransferase family protein [Methanocalculus sp. AMF5]MCP1663263.1 methionyl-tRNA formyltransferase [Methanocalculus sp. AMF5]
MRKIILLSTDTLHHRYFINRLRANGIIFNMILFETDSIKPSYPTNPFFQEEEYRFEKDNFFKTIKSDISDQKIYEFSSINAHDALSIIEKSKPDLGVVFGTRKLDSQIIRSFKDGLINIHRGIAEKYRGLDSDLWAIYHGDHNNIGVTIHWVDEDLDTGEIIFQERTILPEDCRIYQLRYYTTICATELVLETLKQYSNEGIKSKPQSSTGRYYSFMPLCLKKTLVQKFQKEFYK